MNHAALDREILAEKLRRIGVVGDDSADPGRGHNNVIGPFALEERAHRRVVHELEFGVGARKEIAISRSLQTSHDRGAHQATVARNVDFGVQLHFAIWRFSNSAIG